MKAVTFYTKPQCPLCERAEAVLQAAARELAFRWETVDVTRDAEAMAAYGEHIPVVLIDGREHARHRLDPGALRRALRA